MTEAGSNAGHFGRGHGCPDAAPANEESAIGASLEDRDRQGETVIRVVVLGVRSVAPEVDQLVPERNQPVEQLGLELEAGVVRGQCDTHARPPQKVSGPGSRVSIRPLSPSLATRRPISATRSIVKPKCRMMSPTGADAPKWSMPMMAPSSPA